MAVIRQRQAGSGPVSNFRSNAVATSGTFGQLADMMQTAYDFVEPGATQVMEERGAEAGRELARQQFGDPQGATVAVSMSTGGAAAPSIPAFTGFTGDKDPAFFIDGLMKRGMSEKSAKAHVANWMQESALDPGINEADPLVEGSRGGFGLGQWTGPRRRQLEGFASESGRAPGDPEAQMDFLVWESQNTESGAAAQIEAAGDVVSATQVASERFYRPGIPHMDRRLAFAGEIAGLNATGKAIAADTMRALGVEPPPSASQPAAPQVTMSTASAPAASQPAPPPKTTIIDKDGKRQPRLFSPLSGPILQAHNAAAQVAYNAEVRVAAGKELLGMSNDFLLNPDGFRQAATGYVDQLVKQAPAAFRAELRAELSDHVNGRYMGMIEEVFDDQRQRADNSSRALVEMRSDALTAAMVSGDPNQIAAATAGLSDILRARESLPGLAWTPEQSANAIRKAQEAGQAEVVRQQKVQAGVWKDQFDVVIAAAKSGSTSAYDALIQNPAAVASNPDKAREAAGFMMLRDNLPSFFQMPPAEMDAAIAEMDAAPVREEWELDVRKAAKDAAGDAKAALEADPIQYAQDRLGEKPPPIIPPTESPGAFVTSLADRAEYAQKMVAGGYTKTATLLSAKEAEQFGAMFGKETPVEMKAVAAKAIVDGMGPMAGQFFKEIKADDPVFKMAGMMMAKSGDTSVAMEALQGQELLEAGVVTVPSKSGQIEAISPEVSQALKVVPGVLQGDMMKLATAIYANSAQGVTDAEAQKTLMGEAIQKALGQTQSPQGATLGGVQSIGEYPTLLPPGTDGAKVNEALQTAWRGSGAMGGRAGMTGTYGTDVWGALGQAPMMGGKPVPAKYQEYIQLVPLGNDGRYQMMFQLSGQTQPVMNQDGGFMVFKMEDLIKAATPVTPPPPAQEPMMVDRQSYTLPELLFGTDKQPIMQEVKP
jgi:hypothetical protein